MKRKALEGAFSVRKNFAGDGTPRNNDGLAEKCRLCQPSGICSEFNKVAYVHDTQMTCIKMFTTLKKLRNLAFNKSIGDLFSAFSIHEKHQAYDSCDLSGATFRVSRYLQVLYQSNTNCRVPLSLNGLEGSVAAKMVESGRKLLKWGLG